MWTSWFWKSMRNASSKCRPRTTLNVETGSVWRRRAAPTRAPGTLFGQLQQASNIREQDAQARGANVAGTGPSRSVTRMTSREGRLRRAPEHCGQAGRASETSRRGIERKTAGTEGHDSGSKPLRTTFPRTKAASSEERDAPWSRAAQQRASTRVRPGG